MTSDSDSEQDTATNDKVLKRADGGEVMVDLGAVDSGAPSPPFAGDDDPEEPGGEAEEEVAPVELLVQLADRGEINPWDIDIVTVTDKFLAALDDADLRAGGRALFYASVLLRMKSDAIMEDDEPEEFDEFEPWEQPPEDDGWGGPDPFDALEDEMDRRLERKRARGMPQTLDELVRELREAERGTWWKEHREYDTSNSPKGFRRGTQTLDYRSADDLRMDDEPREADVTGTAHGEHMEDTIRHVNRALREQYDNGRVEVLFEEVRDVGESVVETYLALLFLAHRGQVYLQQDELFGDLWIQDAGQVDLPEDPGGAAEPVTEDEAEEGGESAEDATAADD